MTWKDKGAKIAKTILKRMDKVEGFALPLFWTEYTAIVVKAGGPGIGTDRHTDRWSALESPEIASHEYGQLTFDKDAKAMQWQ